MSNKFLPINLPHDRKAQFSDILKHRYLLLILCGIFAFIGFLPVIFVYFITTYVSNEQIFSKIVESYTSDINQQAFIYFWTINISYLIMIPLLMIGFLFLIGILRIYRLLGWGEGIFFFHDFLKGIKANFKTGLLLGAVLGIYIFISKFIGGSISLYVDGNIGIGIEIFLKGVMFIFIIPICFSILILTTYFDEKILTAIVNGFYLYTNKLFAYIACSLAILVIYLIPFIGNYYLILFAIISIMLFIFPIYVLIYNQISLNVFDKTVETEGVKLKGLYNPDNF